MAPQQIRPMRGILIPALTLALVLAGCKSGSGKAAAKTDAPIATKVSAPAIVNVPQFNADSAYSYVKAQTDFGPRVPNTAQHKACAEYLASALEEFGAEVISQPIEVTAFDGTVIKGWNIIGQYKPENPKRIIICSHWDSRPWADNDPDKSRRREPVMAANDGASGVGVILEIARQMQQAMPAIGVDCIFFDAEDWGPSDDWTGSHLDTYWGLGTQYWARRPHRDGYNARYAILLDMVGGQGASFSREGFSVGYAAGVTDKVWKAASALGYSKIFKDRDGGYVTDDHVFINRIAKIPAIDIVPFQPECEQSTFGPTWHTVIDDIEHIDRSTLQAVGQTLLQVIYNEK